MTRKSSNKSTDFKPEDYDGIRERLMLTRLDIQKLPATQNQQYAAQHVWNAILWLDQAKFEQVREE